jgi:hypothetical protein
MPMTDDAERLRMELLEKLDRQISRDRIREILLATPERERRAALKILANDVSRAVFYVFRGKVPIRKGAITKNAARDREIVLMRNAGKTYGQIAKELKMKRTAVPAAIKRYWKPLDNNF